MSMRFHLPPGGDIPTVTAARRLALTETEFLELLPDLLARGFPAADPTTRRYDLDAIDEWRQRRHKAIDTTVAKDARHVAMNRISSGAWAK